jgi:hypothetical protein
MSVFLSAFGQIASGGLLLPALGAEPVPTPIVGLPDM